MRSKRSRCLVFFALRERIPFRRSFFRAVLGLSTVLFFGGCINQVDTPSNEVQVWGKLGLGDGRFQKPRAIAIDDNNEIYIVDMTARIQVFSKTGDFLRSWRTPVSTTGKPCGLSFSNDGLLMVADTHYYRVLFFTTDGKWVEKRTIGGENGRGPGQFGFVTDVVQDSKGNYYISEYGDYDRIQKFDSEGNFLFEWGGHGEEKGKFLRPQGLTIDSNDHVWVADACNHRIQVFDATGDEAKIVRVWGDFGEADGQLRYPYDLLLDHRGHVFVCEFGNSRVQQFDIDGNFIARWGSPGRERGQLHQPWGMAMDKRGILHILDSYNHRVQSFDWQAFRTASEAETE